MNISIDFIITQSLGIIATVLFIVSYQVRSNKALFLMQAAACGAFAVQYLLLGAYSGCMSQIYVITRNILLSRYNQWPWVRSRLCMVVFICLAILMTLLTWDGPISLMPMGIVIAGTISMWTNNAGIIRLAGLIFVSPPWIIYDVMVGAYTAIINEVIVIASVLYSIYRFGWKQMIDPESEFQKH